MTEDLDAKITELVMTLNEQRLTLGDSMVKFMLTSAIRLKRMRSNEKDEFDLVLEKNEAYKVLCQELGIK